MSAVLIGVTKPQARPEMLPGEQDPVLVVVAHRAAAGAPPVHRARLHMPRPLDLVTSPGPDNRAEHFRGGSRAGSIDPRKITDALTLNNKTH